MNIKVSFNDTLYGEGIESVQMVSIANGRVDVWKESGAHLTYDLREVSNVAVGRPYDDERRGITVVTQFRNNHRRTDKDARWYSFNTWFGCGADNTKSWRSRSVKHVLIVEQSFLDGITQ